MNAILHAHNTETTTRHDTPVSLLRTLVLCDLADSTALTERLGDLRAAELFRRHDRLARTLVHQFGGREIDKTDGFLMMFNRPIEAVAFALAYQRSLRQLEDAGIKAPLRARVGVHVGDVIAWDNTPEDIAKGAKPFEVEGLIKPVTSRLMQLALPGQILLSGVAYQLAHRAQDELGDQAATTLWRTHGRYRFKGLPDPIAVFEVGEADIAPLKAPPWSGKAHREVPFWRRPATMAIEIALLMLLGALPLWYLLRPEPAIAFVKRDWVVVGDLKNLTDETGFDDSLETAFRLGLEQSRYVNVLSELKTRETVKLMQRDPEKTRIDRAIGSEVAIRDGVRALILPTVAEIGGRVRVTAEVIDPQTQTTVWSESADGAGAESVLPSLDKINQKLRVRLGEALATVSSESQPLAKVATKNLDALRAYSLAEHAYNATHFKESLALYQQAIKLDSDFALARIGFARALVVSGQNEQAVAELKSARATNDRLSPRDALYLEAWQASLSGAQPPAIDKWKLLATLYPDFFTARGLFAYFSWQFTNRYSDDVVESAKAAASPRNPYAPTSHVVLGMLHLGRGEYDLATQDFAAAKAGGLEWSADFVLVDAVRRNFDKVDALLANSHAFDLPGKDIEAYIPQIALAIDQGNWEKARNLTQAGQKMALELKHPYLRVLDAIGLGLGAQIDPDAQTSELRAHAKSLAASLASVPATDREEVQFDLLFMGYLLANRGEADLASETIAAAGPEPQTGDYPMLTKMRVVAEAEREQRAGHAADAIKLLQPTLDGSELYISHAVLMEAHAANKDMTAALDEARWLTAHRGRAYAEFTGPQEILMPLNVCVSTLAWLNVAEYSATLGKKEDAKAALAELHKAWPKADQLPAVAPRIKKIQTES